MFISPRSMSIILSCQEVYLLSICIFPLFQDEGDVSCPGPADRKPWAGARTSVSIGNLPLVSFLQHCSHQSWMSLNDYKAVHPLSFAAVVRSRLIFPRKNLGRESNPERRGGKREGYLCAIPNPSSFKRTVEDSHSSHFEDPLSLSFESLVST